MFELIVNKSFKYEAYPGSHHNIDFLFKEDLTKDRDLSFLEVFWEINGNEIYMITDNKLTVFDQHYDIFSSGILDNDRPDLNIYLVGRIVPTIYDSFDIWDYYILASSKEEALKTLEMKNRQSGIFDINPNDIIVMGRYYQS